MVNHDYCCAKKKEESAKCDCTRSYPVKVWDGAEDLGDLSDGYIYDFRRSIVIKALEQNDADDDGQPLYCYHNMTNEELEEHFCSSGFVHDAYMHEVIDD